MEKKDWKQRLGSYDSWAMNESMFITIDGETIYTLDKLLDFIQQELDKAREEGYGEGWGDCERFHLLLEQAEEDILSAEEITELDLLQEELSKLKDNK
jgi:hypothetical protein